MNLLCLSDTIRYVLPLNSNRSDVIVCHGELGIGGECCDMGQNDTIGKIELKLNFHLVK